MPKRIHTKEFEMKLIAGQMNVKIKLCKVGYAEGAKRPKRVKIETQVVFNAPTIVLKKAA
jgi:hypothetical protein